MSMQGTPIAQLSEDQIPELRNLPVYADGDEIGHVGDIYYDEDGGTVQCLGVKGDALGFSRQWIPAEGAVFTGDRIELSYGRGQFDDAPQFEDEELDQQQFEQVRDHFVRHEEELQVGKQTESAGTVRLRKWVETEPVTMDVDLKRETARVVSEQIDQPVDEAAGAFADQEVEVELTAERPVVAKQTVAKERVGIERDVETDQVTVQEEVRKERVDVDADGEIEKPS